MTTAGRVALLSTLGFGAGFGIYLYNRKKQQTTLIQTNGDDPAPAISYSQPGNPVTNSSTPLNPLNVLKDAAAVGNLAKSLPTLAKSLGLTTGGATTVVSGITSSAPEITEAVNTAALATNAAPEAIEAATAAANTAATDALAAGATSAEATASAGNAAAPFLGIGVAPVILIAASLAVLVTAISNFTWDAGEALAAQRKKEQDDYWRSQGATEAQIAIHDAGGAWSGDDTSNTIFNNDGRADQDGDKILQVMNGLPASRKDLGVMIARQIMKSDLSGIGSSRLLN